MKQPPQARPLNAAAPTPFSWRTVSGLDVLAANLDLTQRTLHLCHIARAEAKEDSFYAALETALAQGKNADVETLRGRVAKIAEQYPLYDGLEDWKLV